MTKRTPSARPDSRTHAPEPESLDELRLDCSRMAARWTGPRPARTGPAPAAPAATHGVRVPARSARLLEGMSDYGD